MTNPEPEILSQLEKLGHVVFRSGSYNLNIIGVRSPNREANKFDDRLHVVFKDEFDVWQDLSFQITTDAGSYWLFNPMKVTGTAILVAGQYRGVYKIDLHNGKYEALCQRAGKVRVYRDGDKDNTHDRDPSSIVEGYFGINIHRASSKKESTQVDKWSAGCQVFSDPDEFDVFMALCRKSSAIWGETFTYTLIEE